MTTIHVQHPHPDEPRDYGPRLAKGEARRCRTPNCGRPLPASSRRHVCSRCTVAASRGRTVEGPCAVCSNPDVRVLVRAELADGTFVLCANDKAIAGRLRLTLEQLRREVAGGAGKRAA